MKKVATLMAVGLLLLAGCGAPKSDLATSAEDIKGTWHYDGPGYGWYVQFFEDGAMHHAQRRELLEDHPLFKGEFWFEGTQMFTNYGSSHRCEDVTSIYEVHLLANGNLRFVEIEDECAFRVSTLQGREVQKEFEPVP